jgi:hypothetical protein
MTLAEISEWERYDRPHASIDHLLDLVARLRAQMVAAHGAHLENCFLDDTHETCTCGARALLEESTP